MEARALPREAAAGSAGLIAPRLLRAATDARLVALVRQGHAAAFEAVYDRYHRPILSFCRHMLGDPEEAADAVQQTFMSAYTSMTTSNDPLLLRPWLFTIARNRCYSMLRSRREQPASDTVEPATEGLAAQVQRREDLRQLLVDMRELPDEQRAALVLAELGALSHNEIATTLGVPPAKVKALVFQARESLVASRSARDTDCSEIRRELASARGAALRRANLRRHLRQCQGCQEYRKSVQRQRRALAAILPVVPGAALKDAVLGATTGGSSLGTGAAVSGGLLASSALKGLALKALIGGFAALLGIAGTVGLVHVLGTHDTPSALADTARPGPDASRGTLQAGAIPFAHVAAAHHARAAAAGGRAARSGAPDRTSAASGGSAHSALTHRRTSAVSGRAAIRASSPAVASRPHPHHTASGTHTGTAQPVAPTGAAHAPSAAPGHGHGNGNAYGHDPGHDPGLHLGWGQGDGGGRSHPRPGHGG